MKRLITYGLAMLTFAGCSIFRPQPISLEGALEEKYSQQLPPGKGLDEFIDVYNNFNLLDYPGEEPGFIPEVNIDSTGTIRSLAYAPAHFEGFSAEYGNLVDAIEGASNLDLGVEFTQDYMFNFDYGLDSLIDRKNSEVSIEEMLNIKNGAFKHAGSSLTSLTRQSEISSRRGDKLGEDFKDDTIGFLSYKIIDDSVEMLGLYSSLAASIKYGHEYSDEQRRDVDGMVIEDNQLYVDRLLTEGRILTETALEYSIGMELKSDSDDTRAYSQHNSSLYRGVLNSLDSLECGRIYQVLRDNGVGNYQENPYPTE